MSSIFDYISDINLFDTVEYLRDQQFFDLIFPFLLVYAILVTILPNIRLFQDKQGNPHRKITTLIALIVTIFGVSFELPSGYTVGNLMSFLFPNISTLTITILTLYVVGGILGVDVFKGLFRKDFNAYLFFVMAGIGLGAVIFYTGIVLGFWSYDVYDELALWNVTLAVGLGILGIVFLIIGQFVLGILLIVLVVTFILGDQERSILYSFVDPVIFVVVMAVLLFFVSASDSDKKKKLSKDLRDAEKTRERYVELYSGKPKDYDSRVFDIIDENYKNNKKEWQKQYGDEKY